MVNLVFLGSKPIGEALGSHTNILASRDLLHSRYVELPFYIELEFLNISFNIMIGLMQQSHSCRTGWGRVTCSEARCKGHVLKIKKNSEKEER